MRIINRKELMKMKAPFIFSHYSPCNIDDLFICTDTTYHGNDFIEAQLLGEAISMDGKNEDTIGVLIDAEENGTEFKLDLECGGREGLFDDTKLYAVYNNEDIQRLIDKLSSVIKAQE